VGIQILRHFIPRDSKRFGKFAGLGEWVFTRADFDKFGGEHRHGITISRWLLLVRLGEQNAHDRQDETTSQVRQPIVLHAHATLLSTDEPDNGIEPVESAALSMVRWEQTG
jgi:hypothetical protein